MQLRTHKVTLRPTSPSKTASELEPAHKVARILLSTRDEHVWGRIGMLLLVSTSTEKYVKTLKPMSDMLTPAAIAALGELYCAPDDSTLERRRACVLECIAQEKVFEKYPSDSLHEKQFGDVEVAINDLPVGPERLDVCVLAGCAAQGGEFHECKSNVGGASRISAQVRLLERIYQGLTEWPRRPNLILGIISYNHDGTRIQEMIDDCREGKHVRAIGFGSLFSSFRFMRVCNCVTRPTQ